jgi:hypothetical protein
VRSQNKILFALTGAAKVTDYHKSAIGDLACLAVKQNFKFGIIKQKKSTPCYAA